MTFVGYFSGTTYQGAATGCLNGGAVYAAGNPPVNHEHSDVLLGRRSDDVPALRRDAAVEFWTLIGPVGMVAS